jgi:hypothetical protein
MRVKDGKSSFFVEAAFHRQGKPYHSMESAWE